MSLHAYGLTLRLQHGLQLRPSKVGRPKGSRNKLPRAREKEKATQISKKHYHSYDTAANPNISSRDVELRVHQAHQISSASSPCFRTAELSSNDEGAHHRWHQACRNHHTFTPTQEQAIHFKFPNAVSASLFEPLCCNRPFPAAAPNLTSGGAPPFEPPDTYPSSTPDAAAPGHGGPGFADPFHLDWPHW
jgi:hypothetical protein